MWLKVIIVVLFVLLVASLFTGFGFLIKDEGARNKKRVMYALGTRVTITALLIGFIAYGIFSGKIESKAPWGQLPVEQQNSK